MYAGIADRLDQMGVGPLPQRPFDAAGGLGADQRDQRHRRFAGSPGHLLVARHVGIEEDEIGKPRTGRQVGPADLRHEPDRRELAGHRRTVGMGPVQDQRPRAAQMGNTTGTAFHETTLSGGRSANRRAS